MCCESLEPAHVSIRPLSSLLVVFSERACAINALVDVLELSRGRVALASRTILNPKDSLGICTHVEVFSINP